MNTDHTQQQTQGDVRKSEKLSLQAASPPAIAGYQTLRPLGEGAFGHVWLAMDLNTNRPVAIKCYTQRSNLNLDLLGREVSLLANMATGRHIVQVLKVGWSHDPPYYVMEYLENGSLDDWIRSGEDLSVPQCVTVMREIAEGLSFAHGKGILHCDLKPANVLLDHLFHPRLADFGQGRVAGDQTGSLGTLFFMAPEQADLQSPPDVTWDVYGLGAIAYTMLVGVPPFRTSQVLEALDTAKSLQDRLKKYQQIIQSSPKPTLHYRRRGVDKPLAQIIDRCLHLNPERRYQNIQQVIGALDNRQRARNRRPLYVLGLIGPLLLMLLTLFFSMRSRMMALDQSEQSVVQRALESNQFAARYAARTLETEIQSLFRLVELEADRTELKVLLREYSSQAAEILDSIAQGDRRTELRDAVVEMPERIPLDDYLKQRVSLMSSNRTHASALVNSIFINDWRGTNLGICFTDEEEQESANSPVGQNFAFRSYFTGDRIDGSASAPADTYQPTRTTRLSATFRSTSTGVWKIAISTPVYDERSRPPESAGKSLGQEPAQKLLGVLVLTINLGDFELLSEADSSRKSLVRFAALFDGRKGNQLGTLLQHPFISSLDRETLRNIAIPQISQPVIEQLIGNGVYEYLDPAAAFPGGQMFSGHWIASSAQVELPRSGLDTTDNREKSDLWILVQESRDSVSAPIQSLSSQLFRESLLEFATLLSVILVLWYFVYRLGQVRATQKNRNHASAESLSAATETKKL
jgi:serine/threonine protein kinase